MKVQILRKNLLSNPGVPNLGPGNLITPKEVKFMGATEKHIKLEKNAKRPCTVYLQFIPRCLSGPVLFALNHFKFRWGNSILN